jgi:hypothetical protein
MMRKIAVCLLTAALFGGAAPPSFAKGHHARHAGAAAKTGGRLGKGARPGVAPVKAGDRGTPGVDEMTAPPVPHQPLPGLARTHNGSAGVKIVPPGKTAAPRVPSASPVVVRNAIGQPVVPRVSALPNSPHPLLPPAAAAGPTAIARPANSWSRPAGINSSAPPPHPITTAGMSSRSTIDGASLIRPAHSLTILGGPAKTRTGVDGTTIRPKH